MLFAGVESDGPTTLDYLTAIAAAKPSVTEEVRTAFQEDVDLLSRL